MIKVARHIISAVRQVFRRSAIQHIGVLTISQYLSTGLGVLTTIIAARILGAKGYGQAALILAFPSLLLSIGSFKSITVTTRYLAGFRATGKTEELKAIGKLGYAIDLGAFLVVFLIIILTGRWVSEHFYRAPWMFWPMVLYAASFPLLSFKGGSFAILIAFEKFRLLSLLYVLEKGMRLIWVIAFLFAGYGVIGVVLGMAIGNILIGLISLGVATSLLIRNGVGLWWKGSLKSVGHLLREIFSFFGWNYLMVTLGGAITQVPVMLLGTIRGAEEAGFFRLAMTLANISSYPMGAANRVAYPRLSARWAKGRSDMSLRQDVRRWTLRGGLPLGLTVIGMIPLLPLVIPLIFGENYRPMVLGAQIMMLGVTIGAVFFWLNSFYYASGRVRLWVLGYALYAALVLGPSWFIIQSWGFLGLVSLVAVGKILFTFLMLVLLLWQFKRR